MIHLKHISGYQMRGDRLKQLRKTRGMSQLDLAEALDTTQSQVSRWENEGYVPSSESIVLLSEHFNVTADYILGLVDHPDGQISMSDLDPIEQNLIKLYRNKSLKDAISLLLQMDDQE